MCMHGGGGAAGERERERLNLQQTDSPLSGEPATGLDVGILS